MFKTILLSLFLVGSHHFETVTPTPSPAVNQAPQLKGYEIGTQTGTEDEPFKFDVPVEDIFYDDNELTYSSNEATKEALPKWLAFNDEAYSFFGLPSNTDIGRYNISLTATDQGGLEASTYFLIEIMGQSENKDSLSSGGITGIILGLLAAISPCIVDGIAYARWRIKKKTEEDEDGPSSLLTCENYRSECCKGKFKFLNCYNKCDGCCSTVFSCFCDDCCKACCKEDSCNCCVSSYHHPSGNDEKSLEKHHTNNEQNLTVGGNITASSGGAVNINNSNKSNNSTHTTHVKNEPSYHHSSGNEKKELKTHHTNNEQNFTIGGSISGDKVNIDNSNKSNNSTHIKNDHRSQVTNHYHHNVQVVKEEKNTTSNQRLELEKLKIEIENLRNQLKDKDTKLNDKSQQLNEKSEHLNELKFSLKEKDINHQNELREKDQKIEEHTNELNNKNERIETLSNQLKDKDTKLDELKSTLKEKDINHQHEIKEKAQEHTNELSNKKERIESLNNQLNEKSQELKEKDEQIITLQAQAKQSSNELNNKNERIESLNNQLKDKDTKFSEKSQQLHELKSTLKETSVKHQQEKQKKKERIETLSDRLNEKYQELEEKDEKINMLGNEINKKDNQLKDKKNTINSLNNQVKENEQMIAELQNILENIPKQPLDDNKKKELFNAIENNNIEKVKMFLFAYKDVVSAEGYNRRTPFLYAVEIGQLEVAKLLKERGANIKEEDKYGDNALHLACLESGSVEIVTWLLDVCKIDIESKGDDGRMTPFLCAVASGRLELAKLLKERGANVHEKSKSGNNALHKACYSSSVERVTWLLDECHIDIESKGFKQRTPFLCAAECGHLAVAKLLKERGANVHEKSKSGKNALYAACYRGSVEMVTWLLDECKIDIESKGGYYKITPFLSAATGGHLELAKLLKERGANVHAKNKDGKNALKLTYNEEMINYLKSLGLKDSKLKDSESSWVGKLFTLQ